MGALKSLICTHGCTHDAPICTHGAHRIKSFVLRNEKYYGDALLQKTYTTDFLTKSRVKNEGIVPQYYVQGDHEPIISKEMFLLVQEEIARRQAGKKDVSGRTRIFDLSLLFSHRIL